MAIRTSSGTGNTSNSPFAFGTAVNTGDQLIIASGHTVTRDAALDLGVSPPQTPTTNPTISLATATNVTNLPTGTYQFRYTFVDASAGESHPTVNIGSGAITNGSSKPRVTLPALPSGVSSINLYLSAAGGAAGTETLYASGITGTTYDLESASWTNGTTTQAAAAALPNKAALQINGGGHWVEGHASTMTVRGDVIGGATSGVSSFTGNAGGVLEFDPSSADSPTNASYRFVLGNFNNFGTNWFSLLTSGTSTGSRYEIRTASGSYAAARMDRGTLAFGGAVDSCKWDVEWLDITRLGTASVNPVRLAPSSIAQTFIWEGGKVDTCGTAAPFGTSSVPTNSTVRIRNLTFVNSISGTRNLNLTGSSAIGTGERHIGGCVFDLSVLFTNQRDYTIGEVTEGDGYGNIFYQNCTTSGANAAAVDRGNLYRGLSDSDETPFLAPEPTRNVYLHDHNDANQNPHLAGGGWASVTNRVTYCLFEYTGDADAGDSVLHLNLATAYEVDRNVVTKNGAGTGATGTLITSGAGIVGQTIKARHNTAWVAGQSLVSYAEGAVTSSHAGQIAEVKSNLALQVAGSTPGSSGSFIGIDIFASGETDLLTPAGACNNCLAGTPGSGGTGVVGNFYKGTFSTPPGVDDVALADAAAVGLVNGDARVAEWDDSLGGPGGTRAARIANALAELMKRNDPSGYDTDYTINALRAYVFAGHAPTNEAVRDAGHDGVTIGAMEMAPVPVTATPTTASLTLSTFAPTVSTPRLVTPGTLAMSLTAYAPTAVAPRVVTPGTLALALTSYTPAAGSPVEARPGVVNLSLTAFAPTVSAPRVVTPGAASLATTAYAPTVSAPRVVTPGTLALATTGYAPVANVSIAQAVEVPAASLAIQTFAPVATVAAVPPPPAARTALIATDSRRVSLVAYSPSQT